MRNKNGFTMVEILMAMLIIAILVLIIGILSEIASNTYNKLNKKQQIYNDISYGLKLMQQRVRSSQSSVVKLTGKPNPPWVNGEEVTIDTAIVNGISQNGGFGLYQASGTTQRDFVYLPDKTDETKREAIFSVYGCCDASNDLNFTVTCSSSNPGNPNDCSLGVTAITVIISGIKEKIPFDMESTILKRN
jgi:prepilin-type N-terminal cleavage/methylation domain-containing protein